MVVCPEGGERGAWSCRSPLSGSSIARTRRSLPVGSTNTRVAPTPGLTDTERERVSREGNELASMLLGEETHGSTVEQVVAPRRRFEVTATCHSRVRALRP